jgi:multidrug efflux pump subunit AcrA (membrane-fusion protein)
LLNTQAEARFTSKSVHNAVLVPYDAVQKDPAGEGYGVYVPRENPMTKAKEEVFVKCKLGKDNGIDVEVREGLEEGQLVYTKRPAKRDDKK